MSEFKCFRSVVALGLGLALPGQALPAAEASATHAELVCLLGSEEPLATERLVSSRSGRENRARFALGRRDAGWLPGVETSAALRLEIPLDGLGSGTATSLRDGGSWLQLDWRGLPAWRFSLRALPFDTDYERLGYLHALDWGGTDAARGESIFLAQRGGVPGLELGLQGSRAELWAGLRWAQAPERVAAAAGRRLWAGLLRGSLSLQRNLRADFGLGYFQRAAFGLGSSALPSFVEGASLRLVWQHDLAEPELAAEPFRPPSFRNAASLVASEGPGAALALEGVALVTELRRFEAPAHVALSVAPAAALYGSARGQVLAGHAALAWRSLAFVQRNQPGLLRGETLPGNTSAQSELSAWVGASATSAALGITPSLQLGLLLPAALQGPSALPGYGQTFVVRETGDVLALPVGSARLPIFASRAALRFQLSGTMALAGFIDYERDANRVRFQESSSLGARRVFANPDRLGAGAALLARF